ncbi:hypothetical protein A3C98_02625 [Candidatus Roizmanbacteria bacterium RIFCSPHIGHO2_02_FULL_37_15]|uniref:Methyltransferase domain-containing protein n=1 Tax=Candidatus Roizmanbacteria bacterium RIFCSPLOWO2_01_FULL_37_16 TaxID=1802058 RepID=A0A1F7INH3_9BACT|nr:MAG: hypothetical protein A2859_03070 [Candidatus Roizmanbacteria bacterium RIFCSPHIGHO2_01_FULL_37_16b]OGK20791.1 MAG: hypothetical protein A3C98_02625 [Candidatus Roizmanbacteria bacterium RIFCSPHIGHO2_02_FULL_37_15]OGK31845.1 MAG: hypothetical protein A3F57_01840 [Candidatus Roizmanbacteria bacterium RIFCSPHIGHO2_12_FULL_36_11]OGK44861.1 MAG: hypothetical protein A3B40_03630 [Candidatus Roizmanbacteria bacterium RIFCSPLOWO2_01_FULL_37_16]OGK57799.1 MAG: hypothetical protein A3I50_04520 [C
MKNLLNEKPSLNLRGRLKASAEFVDNKDIRDKSILDIGCGYGWCELNFLKRGAKKIIGIEPSANDLQTAIKNIKNKKIEFKVCDALDLDFKPGSFDTVVCWEVIEHLPKNSENLLFKKIGVVLKKNGALYLSTPNHNFFSNLLDPAYWLIGHRHYSKERLKEFARKNSFTINKIEIKGKIFSALAILNMYLTKWLIKHKLFYEKHLTSLSDEEYNGKSGFVNIFIKYVKY